MGIALITNNILSDSGTAVSGLVPTSRTISTTSPLTGGGDLSADRTIAIPAATSTISGYLTNVDWVTFNSKQNALTNPITGTLTTGYIPKATGTNTIGDSIITANSTNILVSAASVDDYVARFSNTDAGSHGILVKADEFLFVGETIAGANNVYIYGSGNATFIGDITANKFIKSGGTAAQFLMADGSVSTGPSLSGYVPYTGAAANVNLGAYGLTATSLTDGIITISSAQINRADGFVEMQFTGAQGVKVFGNTAYPIVFKSGTGNVLIGQTTDSGYKLDVNGTGRFKSAGVSTFGLDIANTAGNRGAGFYTTGGNNVQLYFYNSAGTEKIVLDGGTGAATFSSSVTTSNGVISNYGRINGRLFVTNEADYGDMTSTTGMVSISYYPAGQEATIRSRNYSTSTNTKLTFDASQFNFSGGNVGIGTTSTGERFEVNGSIKATGRTVLATSTGGVSLGYESGIGYLETWNSSPLIVRTYNYQSFNISGTQALKINTNGNILINTDTDAGYRLFVNGGLAINTGSFHGILGSIQASWGGSTAYPTLYGNTADRWVMHINPHISYTQNGVNGYSGTTYGAMLRMAGNAAADMYWDLGVGVCSVGADKFAIGRNGTALFTITNAGAVTAASFFESSDKTIKTLIEDNYQAKGIESITAKLYTKNGKEELGYFAQDVQGILPSAVSVGTDGLLSLSYREVLVAKVQRTETEVDKLKKRVAELEQQLNLN